MAKKESRENEERRLTEKFGELMNELARMDLREEPDLADILERGYLRSGRGARRAPGRPISCHENAARLWKKNPDSTVIVTGYALSKDGSWRQHSWVKDSTDDRIYETTNPRVAYFGFDLTPDESQRFYDGNVLHRR